MIEVTYSDINKSEPEEKVLIDGLPTERTRIYWKNRAWQIVRNEFHTDEDGYTHTVIKLA